jgi:hypothetical protein
LDTPADAGCEAVGGTADPPQEASNRSAGATRACLNDLTLPVWAGKVNAGLTGC